MPTSYSVFVSTAARNGRIGRAQEKIIQRITLAHFPQGCSILRVRGSWFDPQVSRFRHEEARQVLITTSHARKLRGWCEALGRALRQKELLLVTIGPARGIVIGPVARAPNARKSQSNRHRKRPPVLK